MAGTYPDVPGRRFAYDIDGTVFRTRGSDGVYRTMNDSMILTNDEDDDYWAYDCTPHGGGGDHLFIWVFPELRNLDGYFFHFGFPDGYKTKKSIEWSGDTRDGSDGTWSTIADPFTHFNQTKPNFRNNIQPLALTGVKALRFTVWFNGDTSWNREWLYLHIAHLYGSISTGQNPDRLRLWHPTLDQEADPAALDFGDIAQGAQATKQFRVKNNSASLTANNIDLSTESVSDAMAQGLEFSSDGSSYATTLALGTLAPGAISPVTYLRRTVGATEVATQRAARVKAIAQSWS